MRAEPAGGVNVSSRALARLAAGLLALAATRAAAAPELPAIGASRVEGVAPLAVIFDAVQATDAKYPRPFHSLRYEWDFGDKDAGQWSLSGRSKNRALGPLAAHLFTKGGTYQVSVVVRNPVGETTRRTIQIKVVPEDEYFSAGRTFCYATSGTPGGAGFEGCPAKDARQHLVTPSFESASRRVRTGTRHLFRRGDEFQQNGSFQSPAPGPVLIGTFGKGPKPLMKSRVGEYTRLLEVRDDWRYVGLSLRGAGGIALSRPHDSKINTKNTLFYDIDAKGMYACAEFTNNAGNVPGFNQHIAVVDFSCSEMRPDATGRAFFDRSVNSMYMGIDLDLSASDNSMFRTVYMTKSVIQHSRMKSGRAGTVMALRACSQDSGPGCKNGGVPNRWILISDNQFTETATNAPIRTCTHGECDMAGEHGNQVEDVIFERNFFRFDMVDVAKRTSRHTSNGRYIQLQGSDLTVRNNVFDLTGADPWRFDVVQIDPSGPTDRGKLNRDNVHVYHNTVYADPSTTLQTVTICGSIGGAGQGHRCRNNLLWAPGAKQRAATSGAMWTDSNNLLDGPAPPFATPYKGKRAARARDFAPQPGSKPIDSGFAFPKPAQEFVGEDFEGSCRPAGRGFDVGAFELGASACAR